LDRWRVASVVQVDELHPDPLGFACIYLGNAHNLSSADWLSFDIDERPSRAWIANLDVALAQVFGTMLCRRKEGVVLYGAHALQVAADFYTVFNSGPALAHLERQVLFCDIL
jgi:hypothetical protein